LLYPWGNHQQQQQQQQQQQVPPPIVPTDHDVLSGRGVNIAQHPGNERFRALVNSRYDSNYCTQYSTTEKRAVAKEIIDHIRSLCPPGRFLKRLVRPKHSRGLEGPWEELSEQEAIKKTCQALRDCNRQDRTGYASSVSVPDDVREQQETRLRMGLSNKEQAEQAAAASLRDAQKLMEQNGNGKRHHPGGTISPSIEQGASWLKKQRLDTDATPMHVPSTTPTTAASSGGMLQETSLLDSASTSSPTHHQQIHDVPNVFAGFFGHNHHEHIMPPSPAATNFDNLTSFHDTFNHVGSVEIPHHMKDNSSTNFSGGPELDPLHLAAAAALEGADQYASHFPSLDDDDPVVDDFGPPSPLHPSQSLHQSQHHHHNHHGVLDHDRF